MDFLDVWLNTYLFIVKYFLENRSYGVTRLSAALSTPQICWQQFKMKEDHVSYRNKK